MTTVRRPGGDVTDASVPALAPVADAASDAHRGGGALLGARSRGRDADAVRASLLTLVERFRPDAASALDAVYRLQIADHAPMTLHVQRSRCLVTADTSEAADATLRTDRRTWLALVEGTDDGVGAFLAGRLEVTGDLDLAARFETLFDPGPRATRDLSVRRTRVRGVTIDALVAGSGTPVLLLHGLGASKVSFLPTLDGLADRYEVHALDLPGFGRSSKPLPAGRRYSMAWFAEVVHGYLVANDLRDAHLVGNSMGGRISLELALQRPNSVRSVTGLAPAVAFDETRRLAPLLRMLQPQWLGLAPTPIPSAMVERVVRDLFHDPSRVPARNLEAAALDVLRTAKEPGYRMALLASARSLGVERLTGRRGYWSRLTGSIVPSLWVFGEQDRLVAARYAAKVRDTLPGAEIEVWPDMGHVPQFEDPARTNTTLHRWLHRVDAGR